MAKTLEGHTIAAIATPLGSGGVGIVRISGKTSKSILSDIFKPQNKRKLESHKASVGWVVDNPGDNVDKVMVLYMKAPNSYTGEDVVEINCHGGAAILKEILDLTIKSGARLADNGEFTKRALLNGKIDLVQAEAVNDIISARTKESMRSAAKQMEGVLSKEINIIRTTASDLLAGLEASIDFPGEINDMSYKQAKKSIDNMLKRIEDLIATSDYGRLYREGLTVAITGKPNVGKSSILNAILKEERAIVTKYPGTTRDTIEEGVNIKGIPVNLIDTAGLRVSGGHIEKIGIDKAKKAANSADLTILVLDASNKPNKQDKVAVKHLNKPPKIAVLNKIDLGNKITQKDLKALIKNNVKTVKTSAIKGIGIRDLEAMIFKIAISSACMSGKKVHINSRHKQCLIRAKEALQKCGESVRNRMQADFVAIDLKNAVSALGEITGQEAAEEVINRIFEQFCVGK